MTQIGRDILLILAVLGGGIKIIEVTVAFIYLIEEKCDDFMYYRNVDKRLKKLEDGE